jgi:hypothetical protein
MEVKVRPSKADLQGKVEVAQGAVEPEEKALPEHRVNVSDPGVEEVSFGLGMLFHGGVSLPTGQRLGSFLAAGLKCSLGCPRPCREIPAPGAAWALGVCRLPLSGVIINL